MHATLLESIPLTYELLVGSLSLCERNRYCSEAAIMEPLLGMPAGWLPRDSAQLDTYMREMLASGNIVVTDTSRALARALLYPSQWYVAWPAFRALQLLTIGTLPPSIRSAYGFEWRARDARAFARWTALLRTSLRLLPPLAREWPMARRRGFRRFLDARGRSQTVVIRYLFSDFTLSPRRRLVSDGAWSQAVRTLRRTSAARALAARISGGTRRPTRSRGVGPRLR